MLLWPVWDSAAQRDVFLLAKHAHTHTDSHTLYKRHQRVEESVLSFQENV